MNTLSNESSVFVLGDGRATSNEVLRRSSPIEIVEPLLIPRDGGRLRTGLKTGGAQ